MSYCHDQKRKFLRRLKRHLKKYDGFNWLVHFKGVMGKLESENKKIPDLMRDYASAIKSIKG